MASADPHDSLSRRRFTVLTVGAVALAAVGHELTACRRSDPATSQPAADGDQLRPGDLTDQPLDAGPLSRYRQPGVYVEHRHLGLWIVSNGHRVLALSAICPHLGCLVNWSPSQQQFICPCHLSRFEANGQPLPDQKAKQPLGRLSASIRLSAGSSDAHLWIDPQKSLSADDPSSGVNLQP